MTTVGITWTIWIETPACDPYPPAEKPLHSPFAQKVRFDVILTWDQIGTMIVIPGNTFHITDHPTELGFDTEDPPFQYDIIFGARDGVLDTVDIGGNWFDCTYQSAGYDVNIPKNSKVRIGNRRFLGSSLNLRTYGIHTNTKISKARWALAKDKERRLWVANTENEQIELKRANKDSLVPTSLSTVVPNPYKTRSTAKKRDANVVVDNRGNVDLFYVNTTDNGVEFISTQTNKVGNVPAKFLWPKYSYIVAVGVQSRERPSGCFGMYNGMLCYRRIVGSGTRLRGPRYRLIEQPTTPLGSTEILVEDPENLTTGEITINDGIHLDTYAIASAANVRNTFDGKYYPTFTLSSPTVREYTNGVLLTQERFIGGLYSFGGAWVYNPTTQLLYHPAFSVHVKDCGFINEEYVSIGKTGTTYVFAQQYLVGSNNRFRLVTTKGESKNVVIDGVTEQVPFIPDWSVLVATVKDGVLDTFPSGVLVAYKAVDEWCGGVVDNTGRVSVLGHKTDNKAFAAYSENLGLNWIWSRVEH